MKLEFVGITNGLDRLATPDEIRTALALFDDTEMQQSKDDSIEVPCDRGGYVRIRTEELEFMSLIEEVDQLTK